jgi:alkylation response protein AidB-like acyl-CoA dehydrogenase
MSTVEPRLAERRIPAGGGYLEAEEIARLSPDELRRRVAQIVPLVAAEAAEAERTRRPSDTVWEALRRSGFFYQLVPRRFGGLEADLDLLIDTGMALAEADASTAWVATFCAEHNWAFAQFPEETQAKIWRGDYPFIIAPMVTFPPGLATPTEGGYRITAHWKWGTGVMHADWIIGAAMLMVDGKPPEALMVMLPAHQAKVLDVWFMDGMAATGSNDIVVKDLFVPEAFTARGVGRPGPRLHPNPLYAAPIIPFLAMAASVPALGAARGMVRQFHGLLSQRVKKGATTSEAEKPAAQMRLAHADMLARSGELLVRDAARGLVEAGQLAEPDQTPRRQALRAQIAFAVGQCREVGQVLMEAAGSSVHVLDNPFQRAFRDINLLSTHVVFDTDLTRELHGRGLLGLPPNSLLN